MSLTAVGVSWESADFCFTHPFPLLMWPIESFEGVHVIEFTAEETESPGNLGEGEGVKEKDEIGNASPSSKVNIRPLSVAP